jgi:hypothetical protein
MQLVHYVQTARLVLFITELEHLRLIAFSVRRVSLLVMQVPLSARLAEQEATLPLLDHLRVSIAQVGVTYLYQVIQQITTTQAIVCCVVQGRRMMWKVLDRARIVMPDLQV